MTRRKTSRPKASKRKTSRRKASKRKASRRNSSRRWSYNTFRATTLRTATCIDECRPTRTVHVLGLGDFDIQSLELFKNNLVPILLKILSSLSDISFILHTPLPDVPDDDTKRLQKQFFEETFPDYTHSFEKFTHNTIVSPSDLIVCPGDIFKWYTSSSPPVLDEKKYSKCKVVEVGYLPGTEWLWENGNFMRVREDGTIVSYIDDLYRCDLMYPNNPTLTWSPVDVLSRIVEIVKRKRADVVQRARPYYTAFTEIQIAQQTCAREVLDVLCKSKNNDDFNEKIVNLPRTRWASEDPFSPQGQWKSLTTA